MSELSFFDYAFIRVIPYVERGEFINAGVILFCRTRRFLDAQVELNPQRLLALAPNCDPHDIQHHIEGIPRICAGGEAAGPIGELTQAERFHWLVAPRSTIIQSSPVHTGRTADPAATLQHLFETIIHI